MKDSRARDRLRARMAVIGLFTLWVVVGAPVEAQGLSFVEFTPVPEDVVQVAANGRFMYDKRTGYVITTVSLKNVSPTPIAPPLYLVLDNLTPTTASVVNSSGTSIDGEPYFRLDFGLAPGETRYVQPFFANVGRSPIHFTPLLFIDTAPPILGIAPPDGSTVDTGTQTITVSYSDSQSGLDLSTLQVQVDGEDATASFDIGPSQASYTADLADGPHTVVAGISDQAGNRGEGSSTFIVEGEVFRAVADCAPTAGPVPLTVRFRSRGEFSGGSIERYRWDFEGDGRFNTTDPVARDYDFTFNAKGTYDALLQVTNNFGDTAEDTCTIDARGNPPTATADGNPSNGPIPLQVGFTCIGTDPDPGGGIVLYEWDFDGDGTFDYSSPTSGATSHTYTGEGTFTALCRVTDDDGMTGQARTSTTVIRSGPPGSPSVQATAVPTSGNAPLAVFFDGSATDNGNIDLWEWDFDGDGSFDYSATDSPATNFTYTNGGVFAAALRATDDDGLTGTDNVEVTVNLTASLSIPDDSFDPSVGEVAAVNTSISAGVPVRVFIKDQAGSVVRSLVDEIRGAGDYSDLWDGRDDTGTLLPHGPYYAIMEYDFGGDARVIDLTNTTGGSRYSFPRNRLPRTFIPYEDDLLEIRFTIGSGAGASEVEAFVGLFNTNTRFITLLQREPFGVGTHTIYWDGLDANGNFAVPPPGDEFLFGIFGYTLPDNVVFVQTAPVISNVSVDPNFFDPATADYLTPAYPVATVTYDLNRLADVELTATNLNTGQILTRVREVNVPGGTGHTIEWDGRADEDSFADVGEYRLTLKATDSTGSTSIVRYALVRVFY